MRGCPLSSQYHKFVGYAFVDDTDIIQSSFTAKEHQVLESLQVGIDTWEHSLKATCGAIVPEKMAWWLVSFRWLAVCLHSG
jgi:DNA replication initiation complex subunit (GINS family)